MNESLPHDARSALVTTPANRYDSAMNADLRENFRRKNGRRPGRPASSGPSPVKILTWLILACAGVMLFAVLYDSKSGLQLPGGAVLGSAGRGPGAAAGAPASSAWFSSARSATAPPASSAPSSPGVLSSAAAFVKHGLSALPIPGHRTSWQRSDLRIARGLVIEQVDNGLVLSCQRWVVSGTQGIYAGDGRGMNPIYANLVDTDELFRFGHLMTVDHGSVRQSTYERELWTPVSYLDGFLLVEGYPAASPGKGKGIKLVVAPDGDTSWQGHTIPAYTASFTLGTDASPQ